MHAIAAFPEFLESLKEPKAPRTLSPSRLAEALELPAQELAGLARVHRNTLQSAPASPKLQSAMRDIVRVLSAAHALNGDVDQSVFWFRNYPIADFGHRTPMQLVEMGKAQAVIDYIESLGAGASG